MKVKLKRNFVTPDGRFRKGVVEIPDKYAKQLPSDAEVIEGPVKQKAPKVEPQAEPEAPEQDEPVKLSFKGGK